MAAFLLPGVQVPAAEARRGRSGVSSVSQHSRQSDGSWLPCIHCSGPSESQRVAAALEKRASGPGRFCTEYLDGPAHSLRIVMPRHNLVWQRTEEKARARRFDWQHSGNA